MDRALRYRFPLTPPSDSGYAVKIIERDRDSVVLTALMQARPFAPTALALLTRLARTPLMGFKVFAGIHWQALRLWTRGHRLRARPPAPAPVSAGARRRRQGSPGLVAGAERRREACPRA
jgi:DUF1365 family protein